MLGRLRMTLDDCLRHFFHLTIGIFREPRQFVDLHFYSKRHQNTAVFQRLVQTMIREQAEKIKDTGPGPIKLRSPEKLCKT